MRCHCSRGRKAASPLNLARRQSQAHVVSAEGLADGQERDAVDRAPGPVAGQRDAPLHFILAQAPKLDSTHSAGRHAGETI